MWCPQGLLEAYVSEAASKPSGPQRAALLAAAACQVLRDSPSLGDHAVGLGYTDSLLGLLAGRLSPGAPHSPRCMPLRRVLSPPCCNRVRSEAERHVRLFPCGVARRCAV